MLFYGVIVKIPVSMSVKCRRAWLRRLLCSAAFLPVLAAGASATPELTSQQSAALNAACDKVMKLWPGAKFEACVSSLSDTVMSMKEADYAAQAYSLCRRSVIARDGFARCILDQESLAKRAGGLPPGAASKLNADLIKAVASDQDYYMDGSIPVRRRRERYACAELGLVPGTGLFDACTDELETQIYFVDHPSD